jgi:methylated-DNA-[protein]-cysteine S-methyltransferase
MSKPHHGLHHDCRAPSAAHPRRRRRRARRSLLRWRRERRAAPGLDRDDRRLRPAAIQLREYFAGKRTRFELRLAPRGTAFQKAVWAALLRIPFGETASYGDIARAIGKPAASRAIGGANHRNPIAIVIPCHRVIGADGSLTGYGGGLDHKRLLLELESRVRSARQRAA